MAPFPALHSYARKLWCAWNSTIGRQTSLPFARATVGFQSLLNQASTVPAPAGKNSRSSRRSWNPAAQLAMERVWYQNARSSGPPRRMAQSPASPETPAGKCVSAYFGNGSCSAGRSARRCNFSFVSARAGSARGRPYSSYFFSAVPRLRKKRSVRASGWMRPRSAKRHVLSGGIMSVVQRRS